MLPPPTNWPEGDRSCSPPGDPAQAAATGCQDEALDGVTYPPHGPDDLMDRPVSELLDLAARRAQRHAFFSILQDASSNGALRNLIRTEARLCRIAEAAIRARSREVARYVSRHRGVEVPPEVVRRDPTLAAFGL